MKADIRDVYDSVAHLFYAIAADKGLEPIEIPKLKAIISSYWLPRNYEDSFAMISPEGHAILLTIDALLREKLTPQHAYRHFEEFYNFYSEIFSTQLKNIILNTANEINDQFEKGQKTASLRIVDIGILFSSPRHSMVESY